MQKSYLSLVALFLLIFSCGDNRLEGVDDLMIRPKNLVNPNNIYPITGKFVHHGTLTVFGSGLVVPNFNTPTTTVTCSQSNYEFFANGFHNIKLYGMAPLCNMILANQTNVPYIYSKTDLKINHGGQVFDLYEEVSDYLIESQMTPVDIDGDGKLDRIYQVFKK